MQNLKSAALAVVLVAGVALTGCASKMGTGATVGAAGGAAAGALTGGSVVQGAAIGAAGGAIVGAVEQNHQNTKKCFERGVEVACPK